MIKTDTLEQIISKNMGNYGYNINLFRSFPCIMDGLKPVQRRTVYTLHDMKLTQGKPHRKVAAVVGNVLGQFHPHSDASVADALVKLGQSFYMNIPIIDGQGSFGSISGDPAAAMRYIECRMTKYCSELLEDIDSNAINWKPNYDNTTVEPETLPVKYPNLLINGAFGIGQAYISSIPPHNPNDVLQLTIDIIKDPNKKLEDVAKQLKPDFPTGGIIVNSSELEKAYTTGTGNIKLRAKIDTDKNGNLVITQIPYMTTVGTILDKIQEKVKDGTIEGISDIIDSTNEKNGVKVIIKIKKGYDVSAVENQLYSYTPLQSTLNLNLIATEGLSFRTYNILELFTKWIEYRKVTLKRIFNFRMSKLRRRIHIIDGLLICLADIDNVIKIIKTAKDRNDSKIKLIKKYSLTDIQADAIVDLQLYRLTGLSIQQLKDEKVNKQNDLDDLAEYFTNPSKLDNYIISELEEGKKRYGKDRITSFTDIDTDANAEASIPNTNHTIFITKDGFVKKTSNDNRSQNSGGVGKSIGKLKDGDYMISAFNCNNKDNILFFTNLGRLLVLKAYEIKDTNLNSFGYLLSTYLTLKKDEKVVTTLSLEDETYKNEDAFLLFVTEKGLIKRSLLSNYTNVNKSGIIALKLNDNDKLVGVRECEEEYDVIIATNKGMGTRYSINEVTLTQRVSLGMKGINLDKDGERVVAFEIIDGTKDYLLVVDNNGNGKRIDLKSFSKQFRTNKAKFISKLKDNDSIVMVKQVSDNDDVTLVSTQKMIKMAVTDVPVLIRSSSPKNIFKIKSNEEVLDGFLG